MDAKTHYTTRDAARILQATEPRVRTWARVGGVVPTKGAGGRPEYTFQQLLLLRTTRGLLEAGVPPRRVRRIWSSLRHQLQDDVPLTSIRILADGDRAIAWDGSAPWQPDSGQFLLDFDAREMVEGGVQIAGCPAEMPSGAADIAHGGAETARSAANAHSAAETARHAAEAARAAAEAARSAAETAIRATALPTAGRTGSVPSAPFKRFAIAPSVPHPSTRRRSGASTPGGSALTAEQWFRLGCELEETSPSEARRAYAQALDADPGFADAHVNLGRLDHDEGMLEAAEAHYREALVHAPDDETCHYNLAVLLEDRKRPHEAIVAYRRAIALDPDAADAHYNLGLLLEGLGRRSEAMRHLMIARGLYARAEKRR